MCAEKPDFIYAGEQAREISFPLGGIGTGCIGLGGNGRLIDWEIYNRPNKGSLNGMSHFAVKAEQDGREIWKRIWPDSMAAGPVIGSARAMVLVRILEQWRDFRIFQTAVLRGPFRLQSWSFPIPIFPAV